MREAKEVSAELETLRERSAAAEAGLNARARRAMRRPRSRSRGRAPPLPRPRRQVECRLRGIRADVDARAGELEALRGRLTEAETELVRVHAELDSRDFELHAMRTRADDRRGRGGERLAGGGGSSGRPNGRPRSGGGRPRRHGASPRSSRPPASEPTERAGPSPRCATSSDREREQSAVSERDLLRTLEGEKARRAELEQRLSEVETSAFAAERAFEELRQAQGRMRAALRSLAEPE